MGEPNCIHLKLTESLYRALENLAGMPHHITLSVQHQPQLCIVTNGVERRFQLEEEKSIPRYFCAASLEKSCALFIGPVLSGLRAVADDESFQNAREGLVKDVEQSRILKLRTLKVQADSASMLKNERLTNRKKNMKNASSSRKRPSSIKATVLESPSIKVSQSRKRRIDMKALDSGASLASLPLNVTRPTVAPSSLPSSPRETAKNETYFGDSGRLALDSTVSVEELVRKRSDAYCRRRALEERLVVALSESDSKVKKDLIDLIAASFGRFYLPNFMGWIRETFRMVTYMAVPCTAFTLVSFPSFTERALAIERVFIFDQTRKDLYPDDLETIDEARKRCGGPFRFSFWKNE
ncbi:unnamed protein product [Dicrocoelium dendriticum]|nr:unnamed protein product [Dicrocoelium dendriticum]